MVLAYFTVKPWRLLFFFRKENPGNNVLVSPLFKVQKVTFEQRGETRTLFLAIQQKSGAKYNKLKI